MPTGPTARQAQRLADELSTLMDKQLDRDDHHLVEFAWRNAFALMLADQIRQDQMSPAEMQRYLDLVCTELRQTTEALVRQGDADGWRLPDADDD